MRKVAVAVLLFSAGTALAADPADFFETHVRPLLAKNCFTCHTDAKMGGLQLDTREHALLGGKSGPVIVPGDPAASRLITAVHYTDAKLKMPPSGKLPDADIEALTTWIKDGAVWPVTAGKVLPPEYVITKEQRQFWAFQPVANPAPPATKTPKWARSDIDRFILAKLEAEHLKPAAPADRRTLIRRAYFDLTGLPPSPAEVSAFIADQSPDAFAAVVDKLLASPRYGERWGRYWLDIARYSDDKLNPTEEEPYPNAFRYRDWVIQAFNEDMPYDQFVMAQIAGDRMPNPEKYQAGLGFYSLSPEFQDDRVDATTRGFLALTVACATCHDHKFDPIPTKDYYSILGVFNNTHVDEAPLAAKDVVNAWHEQKKKVDAKEKELNEFLDTQTQQLAEIFASQAASYFLAISGDQPSNDLDPPTLERWKKYLDNPKPDHPYLDAWHAAKTAEDRRTEAGKFQELLLAVNAEKKGVDDRNHIKLGLDPSRNDLSQANLDSLPRDKFVLWRGIFGESKGAAVLAYREKDLPRYLSGPWKARLETLRAETDGLKKALPPQYPYLQIIKDNAKINDQFVWLRGNRDSKGEPAPPRFLSILSPAEPKPFDKDKQRLELAQAIADPANPLTARVIVNRIWQHHFGTGIVRSASNFGQLGDRPSHPELLDYLANRFVHEGWSVKKLQREIMLSAVYQLSTASTAAADAADPENRWLSHATRRRLEAEAIRDELLFVSGNLEVDSVGGKPAQLDADNHKRTVYGFISRRKLNPYLSLFDYPVPNATSEARNQTNVPAQRLFFMNSPLVLAESKVLTQKTPTIDELYNRLFQRPPTAQERQLGQQFLAQSNNNWPQYAQVLMSSNEFLFIN
jgi:mono/diheme cytochrome c family protein